MSIFAVPVGIGSNVAADDDARNIRAGPVIDPEVARLVRCGGQHVTNGAALNQVVGLGEVKSTVVRLDEARDLRDVADVVGVLEALRGRGGRRAGYGVNGLHSIRQTHRGMQCNGLQEGDRAWRRRNRGDTAKERQSTHRRA